MIKRISPHVWKFPGDSNLYLLELDQNIMIDTGNRGDRQMIEQFLGKVIDFKRIDKVIFTHLHYDHIGNFDLFPNATFHASRSEIEDFNNDPLGAVLNDDIVDKFKVNLGGFPEFDKLEIIPTPGHTRGSVCIWYRDERILFSGDTMFGKKTFGRVDLPTSVPQEMNKSLMRLVACNWKILAPGHDY